MPSLLRMIILCIYIGRMILISGTIFFKHAFTRNYEMAVLLYMVLREGINWKALIHFVSQLYHSFSNPVTYIFTFSRGVNMTDQMSVQRKYTRTCKRLDAILATLIKDWHIFGTCLRLKMTTKESRKTWRLWLMGGTLF